MITLNDLRIDCVVGVLEREQRATQRIVVDLRMWLDLERAGDSGNLSASVDYGVVAEQVRLLAEHGRFRLLESLAVAVCKMLSLPPDPAEGRAAIARVEVAIRKPEILAPVAVPGVTMARDAGWCRVEARDGEDTLVDVPEGGAWRVRRRAGERWASGDRASLILGGSVEAGGRRFGPGDRLPRCVGEVVAASDAVWIAVGRR